MSEIEPTSDSPTEDWHHAWRTTSFQPAASGHATLTIDGGEQFTMPIVGWLNQAEVAYDPTTRTTQPWPNGRGRIVPAYLGSTGEVVAIDAVQVRDQNGNQIESARWIVRAGDGTSEVVINVLPAPIHVEVLEPKTRKVVRDATGNIVKVVEE